MDLQFYPTPPELAKRAWDKFKNGQFERVLEPQAGNGDLADFHPWKRNDRMNCYLNVDCCEIDIERHATLQSKGFNVVGIDFNHFKNGAIYSHIIMNPPFAKGADMVLKAWEILWDGEIVAIINAETLRNPFSKERQMLVRVIQENESEVEFLKDAFTTPDTERKTEVEIALIWLRKRANANAEIIGSLFEEMAVDHMRGAGLAHDFNEENQLAIPNSTIENSVIAFNAAVVAMRQKVVFEARFSYYAAMLGDTMAKRNGEVTDETLAEQIQSTTNLRQRNSVEFVRKSMSKEYDELKDRAWAGVLRSTSVMDRLSQKVQKGLEKEFEKIKKLEFTASNIHGFLHGLILKQSEMNLDMACDVFDTITRYHSDNTCFYMGWKSNDKHRETGRRIKMTRFILPGFGTGGWRSSLDWDMRKQLSDFDKVFAQLDGKLNPDVSLEALFSNRFKELEEGERLGCDYFEVRYYPKRGTIHFFPKDLKLIDRLNRVVGRAREWIPPEWETVSKDFWLQYDTAEKHDAEFRKEVAKTTRYSWDEPLRTLFYQSEETSLAQERASKALATVLEQKGIKVSFQLERQDANETPAPQQGQVNQVCLQLPLLAA